jgi:hypothetical protein
MEWLAYVYVGFLVVMVLGTITYAFLVVRDIFKDW